MQIETPYVDKELEDRILSQCNYIRILEIHENRDMKLAIGVAPKEIHLLHSHTLLID